MNLTDAAIAARRRAKKTQFYEELVTKRQLLTAVRKCVTKLRVYEDGSIEINPSLPEEDRTKLQLEHSDWVSRRTAIDSIEKALEELK